MFFASLAPQVALSLPCNEIYEWVLKEYRRGLRNPAVNFRLGVADQDSTSAVQSKSFRMTTPDERAVMQVYFGTAIMKTLSNDAQVVIATEFERRPGILESYQTYTVYVPVPTGGFHVHQAFMDNDEGVSRRSFFTNTLPSIRNR